jgi:CO/xanthine dehydrogenase FAD-binding subunit
MKRFEYAAPDEVAEVVDLLGEHGHDAKLLAGGQSLVISSSIGSSPPNFSSI